MNYNSHEIQQLIKQEENNAVEFKSCGVHADSLAREITAFSNSSGGVILLGVDDKGIVEGMTHERNWEEWVANIARQNVIPAVQPVYQEVMVGGKRVGVVIVDKGIERPYQTTRSQFYIRVGSTCRVATQGELMRLFQHAGMFHFDLTATDGTSLKDLNLTKIADYFQRWDVDIGADQEDLENLLMNTDIISADGRLTVGGLLVFGLQPQRFLQNGCISFAHYHGTRSESELIDKQVIEGTLDYQVDTCLSVIRNNLKDPSVIMGGKRESINSRYPDKVFRELLVNACVHRNYGIHGSRIRVLMYKDRLEFISPGRLPNTVTIEKLRRGVSYAVNPVIVKFMENLRYIDKLGRGLPMVWAEAQKIGKQPVFAEFGEEFHVILPLK